MLESGFALLDVGGNTGLYVINLVTGAATFIGNTLGTTVSMAIYTEVPAIVALSSDGANLIRLSPLTVGTTTTVAVTGVSASESLVGIDFRPATGQLFGFGVNHAANNGTVYRLDPQTGAAVAIGSTGQVAYVDAVAATVDLPDPATASYGFDFNPTVDRIRVTTSTGLSFRLNQITGAAVDGDLGGSLGSVAGVNTDGNINGGGSTGVGGAAYTNSFAGATATTLYTLDPVANTLNIQNPPNAGTQTAALPITLGGSTLNFSLFGDAFDIPTSVAVSASNTVANGDAYAALNVGGTSSLYQIDLHTGRAINLGALTTPLRGFTIPFASQEIAVEAPTGTIVDDNSGDLDYGSVLVGQSGVRSVVVRNAGNATLTYSTGFTQGTNFFINANGAGSLGPRQSVTLQVTFQPIVGGDLTDTLHIMSDDASEGSFDVDLAGDGVVVLVNDAGVSTNSETRLLVLANDGLSGNAQITQVSGAGVGVDSTGRALLIPAGFTGTITYDTDDGGIHGRGSVTITAGTPVVGAKTYSGVFRDSSRIVGSATATLSVKNLATAQFRAGTVRATAKFDLTNVGATAFAYTSLGLAIGTRQMDGTIDITLLALGGTVTTTLRPCVLTATAAKHHVAIASATGPFVGGGTMIATVGKTGAIAITGTLIDGLPFTAAANLRDDGSFAFYSAVTSAKLPASLGGEFQTADLTATDVTGELFYFKFPQPVTAKGTEKTGITAFLTANGCKFDGTALLPAGGAALVLVGGNLANLESNPVTISATGIPSLVGSLKSWTGVAKKVGKFTATVQVPGIIKPVKGGGLYLPKSKIAWGYFPGTTAGGQINLNVP